MPDTSAPDNSSGVGSGSYALAWHVALTRLSLIDGSVVFVRDDHVVAKGRKGTPEGSPGPSSNDLHEVAFFKRHADDDPQQRAPGYEFLSRCPVKVEATMFAVLKAVASAPPKRYVGGGYWEAMHGDMTGWFEVRVDGPKPRMHYRLFCRLDYAAEGADRPYVVVVTGLSKPFRTTLTDSDYEKVRDLGDEYFARNPRSHL